MTSSLPIPELPIPVLQGQRVRLRVPNFGDAAFILELVNQSSWLNFIGDKKVSNLVDAERYLREGPLWMFQAYQHGLFVVELESKAIGLCGIVKRPYLEHPDLGFALLDSYAGLGLAFEAAHLAMQDVRQRLGVTHLMAICKPDNTRSIALLTRLGFERLGLQTMPGATEPSLVLSRLSD
jgi:[ribosomal protein S5]-alanine N-acetyltransferase